MDITVLTETNGKIMTKRITKTEVIQYDNGFMFDYSNFDIDNIEHLHELLTWLETKPHKIIIRGELIAGIDATKPVLRRKDDDITKSRLKCFKARKSNDWVMLDFDKLPLPDDVREADRIEYLISMLPDYLHDVSYHYQYSSSAGLKGWDTISAHIWMWLSHGRSDDEMNDWAISTGCVDEALMRTVQVHYTAAPIFSQGVHDPVTTRSGIVRKGSDAAFIPIIPKPVFQQFVKRDDGTIERMSEGGFNHHLQSIGLRLHMPIQKAICAWIASTIAPTDVNRLKHRLRLQISMSGRVDTRHYLTDAYLDQCINSALTKVQSASRGLPFIAETPLEKLREKLSRIR